MQIEKYISQLLYEHDCVIVPNFGGLVGNYSSAKLDPVQNKFFPPSKTISFNKNLIHNDGLLANKISVAEKISYAEANVVLKKYAEDLKQSLQKEKKIEWEQIGVVFADDQQTLRFEPFHVKNFLTESYGLVSFHAILRKQTGEENYPSLREKTAEIKFVDRPPVHTQKNTASRRIKKYLAYSAAALPVLLVLLLLLFNFEKIHSVSDKALSYSNLIPFFESVPSYSFRERMPGSFKGIKDFDPFIEFPDTAAYCSLALFDANETEYSVTKKIVVALDKLKQKKIIIKSGLGKEYRYHVIGGCFQFPENAEKFVAQLREKGYQPEIIDLHKGLHRVSISSFSSRQDALHLISSLQSGSEQGAWLLVK